MKTLQEILEVKGAEYAPFDPERFPKIFQKVQNRIKTPKTVQLIGTNGKGTTGRFIAQFLEKKGFRVAHFTSPHIEKINERFWRNGELLSDEELENANKRVQELLSSQDLEEISYFEYLTLLCAVSFENEEYLILEAGLGGEFDSTTALPISLQTFTKIGIDHSEFLGESIEEIATTKLRAIKSLSIVAIQDEECVRKIADEIATTKEEQISFVEDANLDVSEFLQKDEPQFLGENRCTAFCALKALGFSLSPKDLLFDAIFGRVTKFRENIYLDVGHNLSAAREIRKYFQGKKVIIIYNSYKDKDYFSIINELQNVGKTFLHIPIFNERIAKREDIETVLKSFGFSYEPLKEIKNSETYVVFGSFLCVEKFLKFWESCER